MIFCLAFLLLSFCILLLCVLLEMFWLFSVCCLWFILCSWFMPVYVNKLKICHTVEWHHTHTHTVCVSVSQNKCFHTFAHKSHIFMSENTDCEFLMELAIKRTSIHRFKLNLFREKKKKIGSDADTK